MHEFFEECKMNMQLTPNFQLDSRLKQETWNIFYFYDFFYFYFFRKQRRNFWKIFEKFLKRKRKESYPIWATRWTVSCPNSNNPRQRRQKLGARNCDHQWRHQYGTLNCNLNFLSQFRTTKQQVHWVVQVINLTWVRVDPTEIVGLKQAMVILVNLSQADSNGYGVLIIKR